MKRNDLPAVKRYFQRPETYLRKDFGVRIRAAIVADFAQGLPPGAVLDAGCGDGRVSAPLLEVGHRVTFLDPSEPMLGLARQAVPEKHREAAEFVAGTLDVFPPGRSFQFVLCMGLMAHVESVDAALARIAELTAPGGLALVQLTDCSSWIGRVNFGYIAWRERWLPSRGYALNRLDVGDLAARARRAGLSTRAIVRYSLILPGMMRLPNLLLYGLCALSRRWPLCVIGGEAVLILEKAGSSS